MHFKRKNSKRSGRRQDSNALWRSVRRAERDGIGPGGFPCDRYPRAGARQAMATVVEETHKKPHASRSTKKANNKRRGCRHEWVRDEWEDQVPIYRWEDVGDERHVFRDHVTVTVRRHMCLNCGEEREKSLCSDTRVGRRSWSRHPQWNYEYPPRYHMKMTNAGYYSYEEANMVNKF